MLLWSRVKCGYCKKLELRRQCMFMFICLPLFSLAPLCVSDGVCQREKTRAKIASPAPLGQCKVSFENHPACSTTCAGTRITHVPNALIDSRPIVCACVAATARRRPSLPKLTWARNTYLCSRVACRPSSENYPLGCCPWRPTRRRLPLNTLDYKHKIN